MICNAIGALHGPAFDSMNDYYSDDAAVNGMIRRSSRPDVRRRRVSRSSEPAGRAAHRRRNGLRQFDGILSSAGPVLPSIFRVVTRRVEFSLFTSSPAG